MDSGARRFAERNLAESVGLVIVPALEAAAAPQQVIASGLAGIENKPFRHAKNEHAAGGNDDRDHDTDYDQPPPPRAGPRRMMFMPVVRVVRAMIRVIQWRAHARSR